MHEQAMNQWMCGHLGKLTPVFAIEHNQCMHSFIYHDSAIGRQAYLAFATSLQSRRIVLQIVTVVNDNDHVLVYACVRV